MTYLEQLDGLRVSCHHVDGANQGLSSLNDTDVIHVELLLDELQRHVSSNGRYSVQEPMPVKHKQTMFNISVTSLDADICLIPASKSPYLCFRVCCRLLKWLIMNFPLANQCLAGRTMPT